MGGKKAIIKGNVIMKFDGSRRERLFYGFTLLIRLSLGCLFLWSSLPKIRQPYDFLSSVYNYELVGPKLGMLVAVILPWLELLVGLCLLGGIFVGGALLLSIGMAIMFTFTTSFALYRGLKISCGCFGASGIISYSTIIHTCMILLFSIVAYISGIILRPYAELGKSSKTAK